MIMKKTPKKQKETVEACKITFNYKETQRSSLSASIAIYNWK